MKHFKDLNEKEKEQLLLFPSYISLAASTVGEGIDEKEKKAAIKLTHVKTFSSDPELTNFYKSAEQVFEKNIISLANALPHNKEQRLIAINEKLNQLEPIMKKLEPRYASLLKHSMQSYKNHVTNAHRSVLEYFIFPVHIDGLTK